MSDWVKTCANSKSLAADCALAIKKAREAPGNIATLIAPADTAWGEADGSAEAEPAAPRATVANGAVSDAARALTCGEPAMLMLGGAGLRGKALELAGRIAARTGCRLMAEYNNARMECGAGRVKLDRLPYVVDVALAAMKGTRQLVLAGAKNPVTFFAYPGKPSVVKPVDCAITKLAGVEEDIDGALEALAAELNAQRTPPAPISERQRAALPTGAVTPDGIGSVLAALLPENAVVADESITAGRNLSSFMMAAAPHDWLNIMGGSIGWALPAATGAAIGAPDRKVVALEGDGSAMYTVQSLWTMARENLDVTVVLLSNRSYQILHNEFRNMGAGTPGQRATDMLTLDRPHLDWVALARGHGVEAARAETLEEFARQLRGAFARKGPYLIELVI